MDIEMTSMILGYLFVVFLFLFCPWAWNRIKTDRQQRKLKRVVLGWTGMFIFSYKKEWRPAVYYLNVAKTLRRVLLDEFLNMRLPQDEKPTVWILHLGKTESVQPGDCAYLIREDSGSRGWKLSYESISNVSSRGELHTWLQDRDGATLYLANSVEAGYEALFDQILETVTKYRDIPDIWRTVLQEQAVPILLETKDTMGRSPKIEAVRRMIERGPRGFSTLQELTTIQVNELIPW